MKSLRNVNINTFFIFKTENISVRQFCKISKMSRGCLSNIINSEIVVRQSTVDKLNENMKLTDDFLINDIVDNIKLMSLREIDIYLKKLERAKQRDSLFLRRYHENRKTVQRRYNAIEELLNLNKEI